MDWTVHKFGGTSLADAAGYRRVARIVEAQTGSRNAVVVSAMSGVTDALLELVDLAGARDAAYSARADSLRLRQLELAGELLDDRRAADLAAGIEAEFKEIEEVLRATWHMRSAVESARDLVSGFGELWSSRILARYLESLGRSACCLDARQVLIVEPGHPAPVVVRERSQALLEARLAETSAELLVLPGFVASKPDGVPTTLGRNGSDYSASIFAGLLGARTITIWTDVEGVLSADPQRVPEAVVLEELSYDEAMELAYFGARVLHPATMAPAVEQGIPIFVRNTFNADAPGTRIHTASTTNWPIKGLATIDGMALLNLEGTGMIGVPGIAERLFGSLRQAGVSVTMISQGSSEHSICFALPAVQTAAAREAVERAFLTERNQGQIQTLDVTEDCTVLAMVGDNMAGIPGIAGRFFGALGKAGVNVRAIAQGSSERNISIVIDTADTTRALRAVHSGFYLSDQTLSIGLIGPGLVGGTLLAQIARQSERLRAESKIDLRVRGICTSTRMILDDSRIDLDDWKEQLDSAGEDADLEAFARHIQTDAIPHAVLIDCTASPAIARRYVDWIERGIHVITPNKIANTSDLEYYRSLRRFSRGFRTRFFYETTVGAGLPVIQTLRDLIQTGDEVLSIEGILSGSLSYLFNAFDGTRPFSEILREAKNKGYTEPDPRDDLSGMDVARKVVILAREMGLEVELRDVHVEGLVEPESEPRPIDEFFGDLGELDGRMASLLEEARAASAVLRFVGRVEPAGSCSVGLRRFPGDHPFARIRLTDNIVLFRTRRYHENPLVVQGPGAGPDVTAGGVFADLLRLVSTVT